ncbi:MAG: FGGY-family carbohydrate kinase [Acidimicrobiia bacterium]|nr:FGGY-family carbohydrate kinase [Acidimicrobiia bacterium]
MSRVLVVDCGSSTVNAAVVHDGDVMSAARRTCPQIVPPEAPMGREWDPEQLWAVVCEAIRAAAGDTDVDAVVCTTQRLATVFLDAGGDALYAGPNTDARGFAEALELEARVGERLYDTGGHQPPIVLAPARLAWFRAHRPDVAAAVDKIVPVSDWLAFRLCGELACEPSNASDTGLLDVSARSWAIDLAAECGVAATALPPLREAGDALGLVTSTAAADTDLAVGTPVVVGAGDTMAALVGMAIVADGEVGIVAGSTLPVAAVTSAVVTDPHRRLWRGCHAVADRWLLEANGSECGLAQAWFATLLDVAPEEVHTLAAAAPAGGVAPAVLGPGPLDFSDLPLLRAGELRINLPLAQLGPTRAMVARAFVESIAYAARHCLAWVGEATQIDAAVALGGGMAESPLLPDVVASVLGRELRCHDGHVTVRGAAACAEVGLGNQPDVGAAGRTLAGRGRTVSPVDEWVETYAAGYQTWVQTWDRLHEGVARFSSLLDVADTAEGRT